MLDVDIVGCSVGYLHDAAGKWLPRCGEMACANIDNRPWPCIKLTSVSSRSL